MQMHEKTIRFYFFNKYKVASILFCLPKQVIFGIKKARGVKAPRAVLLVFSYRFR